MKFSLQNKCIPKKCNYCKNYYCEFYYVYNSKKDFFNNRRLILCIPCTDKLYPPVEKKTPEEKSLISFLGF